MSKNQNESAEKGEGSTRSKYDRTKSEMSAASRLFPDEAAAVDAAGDDDNN